MAARKDSRIKTKHREAIRTSMIINRLQKHIHGDIEMTASQVQAARVLLGKALPDLKALEVGGDPDRPIEHSITLTPVMPDGG